MQIVKAAFLYFALVFAAGFVLGIVRTVWVASRLGRRRAELLEAPFMLVVTVVAAGWTIARLAVPGMLSTRLGMGGLALSLMIVAEFGLVRWLRGVSIREYLATRDPVSGTVYYVLLAIFALMPLLLSAT